MSQQTETIARSATETRGDREDRPDGDSSADSSVTVDRVETREATWGVVVAVALAGIGFAAASPVLLAAATIPLWFAAATSLTGRPEPAFSAERSLAVDGDSGGEATPADPLSGKPGQVVTVRTTVRNDGSEPAVDLRIVDGVPDALPVVEGSPRACVTLGAGEETTVEYGVELQRGEHTFDETVLRVRDLASVTRVDVSARAAGDSALLCSPAVEQPPLGSGRNDYAGEVPTDDGGSGVEFHSIRDYEPGDSVRSIDWRRYANTRELATVEYRAERSTRILCVVDARPSQFRTPAGSELSTAELCADAAQRTAGRLFEEGHPTGAAGISRGVVGVVPPGTDTVTRQRTTDLLASVPTSDSVPDAALRTLRDSPEVGLPRMLQGETQVFLFSSFVDDGPLDLVEQLRSRGYSVCVVSPEVTGDLGVDQTSGPAEDEAGAVPFEPLAVRLAGIERDDRLSAARAAGATVIEWDLDRSLGLVLDRAMRVVGPR